ncbi:MAG: histidine kinase, partial [Clostridiaceae bacterium]|nr:histidine kinase [Clostridiaceae bacterium]
KMISDLSTFFRLSLSDGETIIPLTDELEHVKSYLSIQKVRYSDILDYKLKISLNTDEILIPKMTLQPIVENAIYHGLKNKRKSGNIYISGYVEDSKVILSVIDDGVGMNDSIRKNVLDIMKSVEKSKSSNGFGLRNVYQRLILYFGSSTQMDIYSVEDQGTIVQITIFANVVS